MIFFGKFFLIAEFYFQIFFLHNKFISETFLVTIKRFPKAANKLEDLQYIWFISSFPKPFCVLEIGFQNSFKTTVAAFQHGF